MQVAKTPTRAATFLAEPTLADALHNVNLPISNKMK